MKTGRPTKYDPKFPDKILTLFAEGRSVCEICAEIGIAKDTFYRWIAEYPEFSDSYKRGLELSQSWWEKIGRAGTVGKIDVNPTMWIFNMKNRFRQDWHDRFEHEHSGSITINVDKDDLDVI